MQKKIVLTTTSIVTCFIAVSAIYTGTIFATNGSPQVLMDSISSMAINEGESVLVTGTATSNDSAISSVDYQIDGEGGDWTSCTLSDHSSPGDKDVSFYTGLGMGFNDRVLELKPQPDGKILVAGGFSYYLGEPVPKMVRLNSNGSRDTSFDSGLGPNWYVEDIDLQDDGKIIIVGQFTSYNGTTTNYIARLNSNGSLDTTFNSGTGAGGILFAVEILSDGKILIGGWLDSYNGTTINRIARLNPDGSIDTTFNPGTNPNVYIRDIKQQNDGKILVGGQFSAINGTPRGNIARLNADGSLDLTFDSGVGGNNSIDRVEIDNAGRIMIGGQFSSYNGTPAVKMARLFDDGTIDTSFNFNNTVSWTVRTINIFQDGRLLITTDKQIKRLNEDGSLDLSFQGGDGFNTDGSMYQTAILPDGKMLFGGVFNRYNETGRGNFLKLNEDGTVDETFIAGSGANSRIQHSAVLPDGKTLIAGEFTSVSGYSTNHIARLNTDGSTDLTFQSNADFGDSITSIFIKHPSDKIVVTYNDYNFPYSSIPAITRLNPDGSLDSTYNNGTGPNDYVTSAIQQPDGKIIITGNFTSYDSTPITKIARINIDGSIDTTFDPGSSVPSGQIRSIEYQDDGKILIGGNFTTFNGVSLNRIARLNPDGSVDTTFNPLAGANSTVQVTLTQDDGKILVGGFFTLFNSQPASYIVRLNSDGSVDNTFSAALDSYMYKFSIQPNGQILIGGNFTTVNSENRSRIALLNVDGSLSDKFSSSIGPNNLVTNFIENGDNMIILGHFLEYNGLPTPYILSMRMNYSANFSCLIDTTEITAGTVITYLRATDVLGASTTPMEYSSFDFFVTPEAENQLASSGVSILNTILVMCILSSVTFMLLEVTVRRLKTKQ